MLFTIPDAQLNERAVEQHGPEALWSAITAFQTPVAKESSSEVQHDTASVMTEVAHLWTIHQWTELQLDSSAALVDISLDDFHPVVLEVSSKEQRNFDNDVTRHMRQMFHGEHRITWQIHHWQLTCFSLLLVQEGDCFADGSWNEG
jgi:hypothetical protein